MPKSSCFLALACLAALSGCASAPPSVAPRFNGVWVNADSGIHSWIEIETHRVVNFGSTQSNGRCLATTVDIVAKDRVVVPVSVLGSGEMSLRLDGGVLLIAGKYATQRYAPSSRESICRGLGGAYLLGAPYPAPGRQ